MLNKATTSETIRQIADIMLELRQERGVETAVLSTGDGLTLNDNVSESGKTAAVAGFMMAAARQSTAMLGIFQEQSLVIYLKNSHFIVFQPFIAMDSPLILTVLFNRSVAYKHLLAQTMQHIQRVMEK